MTFHPAIQLEIARLRRQDLLAEAERERLAKALPRAWRRPTPDVVSPAGGPLYLRQLRAPDRPALIEAFSRLSPQSRYRRFAAPKRKLTPAELDQLTDVDPPQSDAMGAFLGRGDRLVGFAHYAGGDGPLGPELAVAVVDDWQRRGVGTTLARLLIARAQAARHSVVHAHVLADNQAGLGFVQRLGFRFAGRDGLLVVLELAIQQLPTTPGSGLA